VNSEHRDHTDAQAAPRPDLAGYRAELTAYRARWESRRALREVYADTFERVVAELAPSGPTIEIGGGVGTGRSFLPPGGWSGDVFLTPWADLVFDAHAMPFAGGALGNVVMVDVFHHLTRPLDFLDEVERVLAPGGRLVLVEPYLSLTSHAVYRWFHPEGADPAWNPARGGDPSLPVGEWSNQAAESIVFGRGARTFGAHGSLTLARREPFGFAVYLLTGGFQRWTLVPGLFAKPLLRAERRLPRFIRRAFGWRVITVLEKRA
jgi:SAM-dependent methyltransferase